MGFLARGDTACVDAYLTPLLRDYVAELRRELPGSSLRIMQSSGGLTDADRFRGPHAILSGPAGGVVAYAHVAAELGERRAIGFDMGGTSTDVSRVDAGEGGATEFERVYETETAGVRIFAPMLAVHTVAAGGGSLCRFDGYRFKVGPESAGAAPGPLCYGDPRGARAHRHRREPRARTPRRRPLPVSAAARAGADGPTPPGNGAARARRAALARGDRERLPRDRQREHGRGDPAGLGRARLRRARVRAGRVRRRRRPARLRARAPARDPARARASARGRALGVRDGPGRRRLARRGGHRPAAARARPRARAREDLRGARGARARRARGRGLRAGADRGAFRASTCATWAPRPRSRSRSTAPGRCASASTPPTRARSATRGRSSRSRRPSRGSRCSGRHRPVSEPAGREDAARDALRRARARAGWRASSATARSATTSRSTSARRSRLARCWPVPRWCSRRRAPWSSIPASSSRSTRRGGSSSPTWPARRLARARRARSIRSGSRS